MHSLSRRWYLAHTMALQGGERVRGRCEAMVADMRTREVALLERLRAAAHGGALGQEQEVADDVL